MSIGIRRGVAGTFCFSRRWVATAGADVPVAVRAELAVQLEGDAEVAP